MAETSLEMVQRLLKEGKSTAEIRAAINGNRPLPDAAPPLSGPGAGLAATPAGPVPVAVDGEARQRTGALLGWAWLASMALIPALLVVQANPQGPGFGSLANQLLAIGDVVGILGLVAYVLALVLSTRLSWFEDLFGGLNRVLNVHQILGQLSLVAILVHPLFTSGAYFQYGLNVVAHFFVPQLHYIGSAFGIVALLLMIGLLVVTLFVKLGYSLWLSTHKYLGLVYLFIGLHVLFTPNHLGDDVFLRWYLYFLLLVGALAYIYRSLLPNIFVRRYLYTIASAEKKGVGVVEVTLAPLDRKMSFKAGQFVFVSFDNEGLSPEWHPFSISSAESSDKLMIDVKSLGAYTETLTQLLPYMVGVTVRVEGAYGRFSFRNFGNVNQVWVAGGIGITPFLSMVQTLGPGPYNIDLYYSVSTQSELMDLSTLAKHQSNRPGQVLRVFPFITEKYNTFLSADIIAKNSGDLHNRDILLCGPPPMMHAITKQLVGKGVPRGTSIARNLL